MPSRIFMLAFLLSMVLTPSCMNPNLSGGVLHFDQQRYRQAEDCLQRAIAAEPMNAEAWYWLGKTYAEIGNTSSAVAAFDRADMLVSNSDVELRPLVEYAREHYWSLHYNEGLESRKRNDHLSAISSFSIAHQYRPEDPRSALQKALCHMSLGDGDSALAVVQQVRDILDPQNSMESQFFFDCVRHCGDQLAEVGTAEDLKMCLKFYSEAAEVNPNNTDLLFSIGVVHMQLSTLDSTQRAWHTQEALGHFLRTLDLQADDLEAMANVAACYVLLGDCRAALPYAERVAEVDPTPETLATLDSIRECLNPEPKAQRATHTQKTKPSKESEPPWEISDAAYRVVETNEVWWKFAWRFRLRNNTNQRGVVNAEVQFLDGDRFPVEIARAYNLVVDGGAEREFSDFALVTPGPAQTVRFVRVNLVP